MISGKEYTGQFVVPPSGGVTPPEGGTTNLFIVGNRLAYDNRQRVHGAAMKRAKKDNLHFPIRERVSEVSENALLNS